MAIVILRKNWLTYIFYKYLLPFSHKPIPVNELVEEFT